MTVRSSYHIQLCHILTLTLTREKRQSRNSAIKVLDYAMTGPEGLDLCQKFVDVLGLRSVFPLFMKTPKVSDFYQMG